MRVRLLAPFVAGITLAFAITVLPASALNTSVSAVSYTSWNPRNVTIQPGESVTWTNNSGYSHNVCVAAAGESSGCGEWRSDDPLINWPSQGYSHTFANAGTYHYICESHPNMAGTITVGSGSGTGTATGTGTGTSTTPPPSSYPTDTTTVPGQTQQSPGSDPAPAFTSAVKRRSSRRALILVFGSSEPATLKATVWRRPPGSRSFRRLGRASLQLKQGRNVATLPRQATGRLRAGSYRVQLQLVDAAGQRSKSRTLNFKLA
jgi:plastocyanin